MARVLKRPMFRRGGSTNDGIMSGLEDREKFATQGTILDVDRDKRSTDDFIGKAREFTPELESLLREFTPKTRLPLGAVGAALVQGTPIRDALTAGYTDFAKRDDAREAAIRSGAVKLGISQAAAATRSKDAKFSAILKRAQEAFRLGAKNPNTGKPYQSVKEAFERFQMGTGDIESGSVREQILEDFKVFKSGSGGSKEESEFDVLKRIPNRLPIEGTNFGKKDLGIRAEREEIADNEDFGPGDGFFNFADGKLYVLKPGGNKQDFTSNSYIITELSTLY